MVARRTRLRSSWRAIPECMGKRIALFAVMIGLALTVSVCADDNVQAVQEKLRDGGFFSGGIDGGDHSPVAAALARFPICKRLAGSRHAGVATSRGPWPQPPGGPR